MDRFPLRLNPLVSTPTETLIELQSHFPEATFESVAFIPNAFIAADLSRDDLIASPLYKKGKVYIQNLSSMLPALVLDPQQGETVLDMCAAPGSKTTQLAALMQNTGELVANDASRSRMFKLQSLLKQFGVTNTTIKNTKGEFLWRTYPEYFDRVLVDAPCSMDQDLPQKKIKHLAKQQTFLLRSSCSCVRPGGRVVYSTCTSRPEENEHVVEWLLKKRDDMHIVPIDLTHLPETFKTPEGFLRIETHDMYESFFVTCLERTTK